MLILVGQNVKPVQRVGPHRPVGRADTDWVLRYRVRAFDVLPSLQPNLCNLEDSSAHKYRRTAPM